MTIKELVKAVFPSFPNDRHVVETGNREKWYLIDWGERTLYVPFSKVLYANPTEIDRFGEAVIAFSNMTVEDVGGFNWEDLTMEWPKDEHGSLQLIDRLNNQKLISCDIETRRLELEDNKILAIGFSWDDGVGGAITCLTPAVVCALNHLLNNRAITWIWQNGKFDTSRLKYLLNIDARVDEDTMLLHYIGINEKRGTHGLKDLGHLYLQAPRWDDELEAFKRTWCREHKILLGEFMYDLIPIDTLVPYMMKDAIATRRLLPIFKTLQRPGSEWIYRKLIEASNVFRRVELSGFAVDLPYISELAESLCEEIDVAQAEVDKSVNRLWDPMRYARDSGARTVPQEFNLKSPKQLKWLLETAVGHPIQSTDKVALDELAQEAHHLGDGPGKVFIESLMSLRKWNKYVDTYVTGICDVMCRDGRIRCTYNLHGTETGRLSSSEPNMQNIPRDSRIKNLFVAKPGYRLVQFDYSQAELRVLAALSGDPWLISVYTDGKDLHDAVATQMFGSPFTKEQRNQAKTINFGIPYGRGARSLMEAFDMTAGGAQQLIDGWFKPMPGVKKYIADRRQAPFKGIPCTTVFGRLRHFIINFENVGHVQNESINTPIQSTASDLTLLSLLEIDRWLQDEEIDGALVATVHDSIIAEVVDDIEVINRVVKFVEHTMSTLPALYLTEHPVPFRADCETGYRWGDLHKWNYQEELASIETSSSTATMPMVESVVGIERALTHTAAPIPS